MILSVFYVNLCVTPHVHASLAWTCWKWPTSKFPVTSICTLWTSYLSMRLCSAGSLTAQTLKSLDNMCHCLSCYTRAWTLCLLRAPIGRQRLSLQSSWQWARTARLSPVRGQVTDQAPMTTVWALRRLSGLWETMPGSRTTLMGEDTKAPGSEWCGSSVQRGRCTTCPSTLPLCRWYSHQASLPSLLVLCYSIAVCACCSALGDCFSSLCSSPFFVKLLLVTLP